MKIEILEGKSNEYKKAILDAVHVSLVESFKIPDYDRFQRIYELNKDCFEIPSTKSDQAILIELTIFPGRSLQAKKSLYKNIVNKLTENPGIDGNDITIILKEPPMENWGIRGGKAASEVDIGFNIKV
ncbi:tautomerase family protein [Methanobacterium alcaliphilum]|nr:tautomerase family protein [Methanobacterium alcaliphilum]